MRIGLVCPYDLSKPGGVQSQVRGLARYLSRADDHVIVLGPGLTEDLDGVDLGRSISIPGNRSKVPLSVDPRVSGTIAEAARDLDLLHVHEPLMPAVSFSALRAAAPVVGTFHAAPSAVGLGFYTVLKSQMPRLLGPNLRQVTAVSKTAAAPLPDVLDVEIIPNGVDVASFDVGLERMSRRVVFLGRDEKRKGLDVLLGAWEKVTARVPHAELVVMGADRPVPGITWLGTVDEESKMRQLAGAGIYVAPNLGGESFGIVLVEAMAAGAAVVASDLASFREVGGDAVRYFTTGDGNELASTLIQLLESPAELAELAGAGTERAHRFDWESVGSRYRTIYEQALSGR